MAGQCCLPPEAAATGEEGSCSTVTEGKMMMAAPPPVAGEAEGPAADVEDAAGGDGQVVRRPEDEAKVVYAEEDLEFRATLPQWLLDLIDAEIDIPGLEISNRRSDFYEDDEEEGESDEEEGDQAAIAI